MQITSRPTRRPPTTMPRERSAHDAELVDSLDELLEEIDVILSENVLHLRVFRQRGGQ